jgi:hypothetical protein
MVAGTGAAHRGEGTRGGLSRIAQLDQPLPAGPMSALGGSRRAAPKEEVRV